MLEKEGKWIVVRDPADNEVRIVPVKFRRYFVHTAPKWEFIADGKLDELRAMCRLIGKERKMECSNDKNEVFDSFSYYAGEFSWFESGE